MVSFEFQSFSIFLSGVSCLVLAVGSYFGVPETQNLSETKKMQLNIDRFTCIDEIRHVVGSFH